MKTLGFLLLCSCLFGCAVEVAPESAPYTDEAAVCVVNNSGCETAAVVNDVCVTTVLTKGTLCGGSMADAIHGECQGGSAVCFWTDYQCKYDAQGAACGVSALPPYNVGGRCAAGECCRYCVDKSGACVGVVQNGKLVTGGVSCP